MKLKIGDPAPAGVVVDIDGQSTAVEQLWAGGPIFLTFLRHFG
jgi:hypothetical protein